jgi:hypothetical protein
VSENVAKSNFEVISKHISSFNFYVLDENLGLMVARKQKINFEGHKFL